MSNDKTIIKLQTVALSIFVAASVGLFVQNKDLTLDIEGYKAQLKVYETSQSMRRELLGMDKAIAESRCISALELVQEASAKLDEARAKWPDLQEDDFDFSFAPIKH